MQTVCTLCTLCTLFKTGRTTWNKILESQSRKVGDGIRPFIFRVIGRVFVKLGRKGGVLNVWKKCACTPKKCARTQKIVRMYFKSKFLSRDFIKETSLDRYVWHFYCSKHCLIETVLKYTQGYADSMQVECKMYSQSVHLQTWCALF